MRYAYYQLNPKKECISFKQFVHLITYGDDNENNVSDKVPWFNHTAIQIELGKIDVVYTMATKDADSVPYIPFTEVSFLKRKWVQDEESKIWLAPLEWASINKMLTVCTASDSVCMEAHDAQMLRSCVVEMFHHGKEKYADNLAMLKRIAHKSGLIAGDWIATGTFKTWDECIDAHGRCSLGFGEDPFLE